jgi:hypothetical protein
MRFSRASKAGTGGLGCLLCAVLLVVAQLGSGGTPTSRAIDQVRARATRPGPTLPAPPAASPGPVWVPDRIVPAPLAPQGVWIPGHWEQPYGPGRYYVPPLSVCDRATGICSTLPGGVQGPVEQRPLPLDPAVTRGGTTVIAP